MANKQRIIDYLQRHPEGIDDDELAKVLNLKARQQANVICRKLVVENLIQRRLINGKIHNFWIHGEYVEPKDTLSITVPIEKTGNWFWEGNVQTLVIHYLLSENYELLFAANTASREQGKDIVAERNGKTLWVTVKGFPLGTERTKPSTQAGHWFKQAVFDILQYRGESKENELGIALPDYHRYRSLAQKVSWIKPLADFAYFWVRESGEIVVE